MFFKTNLHKWMKSEKLKPSTLAVKAKVSRPSVKDMYNGTAEMLSASTVTGVCKYFNKSVSELFEVEEKKNAQKTDDSISDHESA